MNLLEGLPTEKLTTERENQLAKIIQKSKGKNEEALNELTMHNLKECFLYAKAVSKGKILDDEIFSICYQALFSSAKTFRPNVIRFFSYSKAAVRGALTRHWNSLNTIRSPSGAPAMQKIDQEDSDMLDSQMGSTEPDSQSIFTSERWAIIEPIIQSKLNQQEKMVLELHYRSSLDFEEIGSLLGVTRSAIQNTSQRALKKIRNELYRKHQLFDGQL